MNKLNNQMHWNYFLALEKDLEKISFYIELNKKNFNTYSIKLTQLFLSASSEIDVVLKKICKQINENEKAKKITHYENIIKNQANFSKEKIFIEKTNLVLQPFINWPKTPSWWQDYNYVKHHRDQYFYKASLKNTLDTLSALLIVNFTYYKFYLFGTENQNENVKKETIKQLNSETILMRFSSDYYYGHLLL